MLALACSRAAYTHAGWRFGGGYLDGLRPVDFIEDEEVLVSTARKSLAEEW